MERQCSAEVTQVLAAPAWGEPPLRSGSSAGRKHSHHASPWQQNIATTTTARLLGFTWYLHCHRSYTSTHCCMEPVEGAAEHNAAGQLDSPLSMQEYQSLMQQAQHTFLKWTDMYRIILSVDALELPVRNKPVENPLSKQSSNFLKQRRVSTFLSQVESYSSSKKDIDTIVKMALTGNEKQAGPMGPLGYVSSVGITSRFLCDMLSTCRSCTALRRAYILSRFH